MVMMTSVIRLGHPGVAIVGLGLMADDWTEPTAHVRPGLRVKKVC